MYYDCLSFRFLKLLTIHIHIIVNRETRLFDDDYTADTEKGKRTIESKWNGGKIRMTCCEKIQNYITYHIITHTHTNEVFFHEMSLVSAMYRGINSERTIVLRCMTGFV